MDTKVADPMHGALLGGRYRIMGWLAHGGMATIYVARDERLERSVAVKILHPDRAQDPRLPKWLSDEARTVARLAHPNVVAVFDEGVHDGAPYLVMEYVRGRTLREIIDDRRRLSPVESFAIAEQILAALVGAHKAGLVHRDVKPENILVALPPNGTGDLADAVVKVADFGLAQAGQAAAGAPDTPVMGTAVYVAPELVSDGHADARADVYSVGIVLFEMLTGRVPFDGNPAQVAWQHVDEDVPPPSWAAPGLPVVVDGVVTEATRRDPSQRPNDASAMLAQVRWTREELGPHSRNRALEHPTVLVSPVDQRPSWARLPRQERPETSYTRVIEVVPSTSSVRPWDSMRDRLDLMRRTDRGRRQLTVALAVIGVLLIGGGWWFGFGRYTQAPELTQLTKANAIFEAARFGFHVDFGAPRYSETVPIDTVLDQQPAPGGRIVKGGTITLVLCLGPERYEVPDVAGQAVDIATVRLKEHFVVQTVNGFDDTLPVNYVVGTDPPVGTPLKPNSVVKLIVAKGPYPVHVPNEVGKQLTDAEADLRGMGFDVDVQRKDDQTKPRDQVLEQNPASGQGVAAAGGVKVVLVVANGPPGPVMPAVVGANCRDAVNQLTTLGLQVNANGNDFERAFWVVQSQSPVPGEALQPGQSVDLQCG